MAITTLDGAIAGMQPPQFMTKALTGAVVAGRPHSLFYTAGVPSAGAAPAAVLAGSNHTAPLAGAFPFVENAGGNQYLSRFSATNSAQAGLLLLCDRIWTNGGIVITAATAQTVNSAAFPARDNNASTNGDGILLGLEVSTVTGAGVPTITVSYTNQAGAAGKTGTNTVATVAASAAGTFYPIGLAAGDTGVRSVQTVTLSATWTSGTVNLVAYRVVAALELTAAGIPNAVDVLTSGMPILHDGSCLFPIFIPQTTTTTGFAGTFQQTNG